VIVLLGFSYDVENVLYWFPADGLWFGWGLFSGQLFVSYCVLDLWLRISITVYQEKYKLRLILSSLYWSEKVKCGCQHLLVMWVSSEKVLNKTALYAIPFH